MMPLKGLISSQYRRKPGSIKYLDSGFRRNDGANRIASSKLKFMALTRLLHFINTKRNNQTQVMRENVSAMQNFKSNLRILLCRDRV
jgi:hypothetical protein